MAEKESRTERKKVEEKQRDQNRGKLNKIYFWIIGILFLILFLLVIFIFANSGDDVDLGSEEEASSIVQNTETDTKETTTEETPETSKETEAIEATEESDDEKEVEESEEKQEKETTESETTVNEEAPLDPDYAVDYSNGSADRIRIKEKVMEATGLGNDLIENWVGNNGPGRVTADVYSPDKSEVYRVYLQYGADDWHVTKYESLNAIPEN